MSDLVNELMSKVNINPTEKTRFKFYATDDKDIPSCSMRGDITFKNGRGFKIEFQGPISKMGEFIDCIRNICMVWKEKYNNET